MILDSLENAALYESIHPLFKNAFDFLRTQPLATLPDGRVVLDGDRLFANIETPDAKAKEDCKLEYHRKYIDIQYCLSGEEAMGWTTATGNGHDLGYNEAKDCGFFKDAPQSWFDVRPGSFVIFFPNDAHAPNASRGTHRKIVLKVKVQG